MSEEGWARCFAEPIKAGNRTLVTLRDAGEYISALPAKVSREKHWQTAMSCLIDAADSGGILMLAEIAMRQALAHGKPEPPAEPRRKRVKAYKVI
jgi:hypothetical protein